MSKVRIPTITQQELQERLIYNSETGKFFWRVSGKPAGYTDHRGYLSIRLANDCLVLGHRIAWCYINGYWSVEDIDHINQDKSDNRISNLREASRSQNLMNKSLHRNNKSGHKGVFYSEKQNMYHAYITAYGTRTHLGSFKTKEEAVEIRNLAEELLFGEYRSLSSRHRDVNVQQREST
jgi:hypothetical protein